MNTLTRAVTLDLRRTPAAAREATKAVRRLLADAAAYALLHDATLAVTEIASTIVSRTTGECHLIATFSVDRGRLRVDVIECASVGSDGSWAGIGAHTFPFVAALATEWGIDERAEGTIVWFEMLQVRVADVPV